jgi:hypothetical protein
MELNVDELIEKIYDYYPKHISPFSVEFDESPETRWKVASISKLKLEFFEKWNFLFHSLKMEISGDEISDQSAIYDREFLQLLSLFCNPG